MKLDALKTALSANLQQYRGVAAAKKEGETVHAQPIDPLKPATWTDFTKAMVSWAEDVSGIALTSAPEVDKPTLMQNAKKLLNKTYEYFADDGKSVQLLRFITKLDEKINRAPSQEVVVILLINALAELKELRHSNSFFRESGQCKELEDCLFKGLMVVGSYTKDKQDPYLHDLLQPLRFYFGINKNKKHTADEKSVGGHYVSAFNGVFVQSFFENLKISQTNFLQQTATHYYHFTDSKLACALLYATHEDTFIHAAKALIAKDPKAEAFVKVAWQAAKKKANLSHETQLSDNLIAQMEQLLNPVALDNAVVASVTPFMADVDVETTASVRVPFQDEFIREAVPLLDNPLLENSMVIPIIPVALPHRIDSIQLEQGKWSAKLGLDPDPLKRAMVDGINVCIETFNDGLAKPPFVSKIFQVGESAKEVAADKKAELTVVHATVKQLGSRAEMENLSKSRVRLYEMFNDDFLTKTFDGYLLQYVKGLDAKTKDSLNGYTIKQRYIFLKELDENYQLPASISEEVKAFLTDGKDPVFDGDKNFSARIKEESSIRCDLYELQTLVIARKSTTSLENFVVEDLAKLANRFTTAHNQFEQFNSTLNVEEPDGMVFYREALISTMLSKLQQGVHRTQDGDFTHAKAFSLATKIHKSSSAFLPLQSGYAIHLVDNMASITLQKPSARPKNTTFISQDPAGYYQTNEHGQLKTIETNLSMADLSFHADFFDKGLPFNVDIKAKLSPEKVKKLDDFFHYRNGHFHQDQSMGAVLGKVIDVDENALSFANDVEFPGLEAQDKAVPQAAIIHFSEFILKYGNREQQQILAAIMGGFSAKEGLVLPSEVMIAITQQKSKLPQWRSTIEKNKAVLQELSAILISGKYFEQALRNNGFKNSNLRDKIFDFPNLLEKFKDKLPNELKNNQNFIVAINHQLKSLASEVCRQFKESCNQDPMFFNSDQAKLLTRFIIKHGSPGDRILHYRFLQDAIKIHIDSLVKSDVPDIDVKILALAKLLCLDGSDFKLKDEREKFANHVVDSVVKAKDLGREVPCPAALRDYINLHADVNHKTKFQGKVEAQKATLIATIDKLKADIELYTKEGGTRATEVQLLHTTIQEFRVKINSNEGASTKDLEKFTSTVEKQKNTIEASYSRTSWVWGATHSKLFNVLAKFSSAEVTTQFKVLSDSLQENKIATIVNALLAKSLEGKEIPLADEGTLLKGVDGALKALNNTLKVLANDGKDGMEILAEQMMGFTRLMDNVHKAFPDNVQSVLDKVLQGSTLKPFLDKLGSLTKEESAKFFSSLFTKLQPDELMELVYSFNVGFSVNLSEYVSEGIRDFIDSQLLSLALGATFQQNVEPLSRLVAFFGSDAQKEKHRVLEFIYVQIEDKSAHEDKLLAYPLMDTTARKEEEAILDLSFLQLPPELPPEALFSDVSGGDSFSDDFYSPQAVTARQINDITNERQQFDDRLGDFNGQSLRERYAFTLFDALKRDWQSAFPKKLGDELRTELREEFMQLQTTFLQPSADYGAQLTGFMDKLVKVHPAIKNNPQFSSAQLFFETLVSVDSRQLSVDSSLGSTYTFDDQRVGFIRYALEQALIEGVLSIEQRSTLFQEACLLMESMARAHHPAINEAFITQIVTLFNSTDALLPSLKTDGKVDSHLLALTTAVLNQLKEVLPKDNSQAATECRLAVNAAIKHMVSEAKSNAGPSMRASVVGDVQSSARTSIFSSRATVTQSANITLVNMSESLMALDKKIKAIEPVTTVRFKDIGDAKPHSDVFKEASKNQQYIINNYAVFHSATATATSKLLDKLADVKPIQLRHQLAFIESTVPAREVQSRSAAAIQFHIDHGALNTQIALVLRKVIDLSNDFETLQESEQGFFVESVKALNGKLETLGLPSLKLEQPAAMSELANAVSKYLVLETALKQAMSDLQAYDQLNGVDADNTKKREVARDLSGQVETFLASAKAALISGAAPADDLSTSMAALQNTLMNALKKPSTQFMRLLDKANTDIHQALLVYEAGPQVSIESKKITALQEGLSVAIGKLQRYPRLEDAKANNQAKRQFFNDFRAELQTVSLLLLTSPAEGEKRLAGLSDKIATLEKGLKDSGTEFKKRLDIAKGMITAASSSYQAYVAERLAEQGVRAELVSEIREIVTLFKAKPLEGEQRLIALSDKIAVWEKTCPTEAIKKLLEPVKTKSLAARESYQRSQMATTTNLAQEQVVNELEVLYAHARSDSNESVVTPALVSYDNVSFVPEVHIPRGEEAITTGRESIAVLIERDSYDPAAANATTAVNPLSSRVANARSLHVSADDKIQVRLETPMDAHEIARAMAPVKGLMILLSTLSNGLGNSHSGPGQGKSLSEEAVKEVSLPRDRSPSLSNQNRVMAFLNVALLLQKITGVCMVYFSCAALPYIASVLRMLRLIHA